MKNRIIIVFIFLILLIIFLLIKKPIDSMSDDFSNTQNDIACLDSIKLSEAIYRELNSSFLRDSDDKRVIENGEFLFCNLTPFDLEPTIRNLSGLGKKSKLISPRDIEIDKFYIWIINIEIYKDEACVRMVVNSETPARKKVEPYIYTSFLFFDDDLFCPDCEWDRDTILTYPDSMRLDLLLNDFLDIFHNNWSTWGLFEEEILLIYNGSNVNLDKAIDNLSNFGKPSISILKEECDRKSSVLDIYQFVIKDNIAYICLSHFGGGSEAILVFKDNQWKVLANTNWVF